MWRVQNFWFSIKRFTWYSLLCFIHGHNIQDRDDMYPQLGSICFTCYRDGEDIEYEYGLVYWLNNLYAKYVDWVHRTGREEKLWPIEERFQSWFHAKFPRGKLRNWIYRWWEY